MEQLTRSLLTTGKIKVDYNKQTEVPLKEKVLQFGEGNFLRAFIDWMIDELNFNNKFNGSVVVVQPLPSGLIDMLNDQDGLYTLMLRGIENGEVKDKRKIISSISRGINPFANWQDYLETAENPSMELIVSNTTEAGIEFKKEPFNTNTCPQTFPAKLTAWLYKRFTCFAGDATKGMIIMPCELINYNGTKLKECILSYSDYWNLGIEFKTWINESNSFLSTLVDRIVPGYPRDDIDTITAELGYKDNLIDTGEIFHLLVVEGADEKARDLIPFDKIGLNVVFTNNMQPYRTRKVAILNGAHTGNVLGAHLAGLDTVGEMLGDEDFSVFLKDMLLTEIVPTLELPQEEKESYAKTILERFANPFIRHELLSISLNSVAKWKVRVLPSLKKYVETEKKIPTRLAFSLAALIAFYNGKYTESNKFIGTANNKEYLINDSKDITDFFSRAYAKDSTATTVNSVLSNTDFWDEDLTAISGLKEEVVKYCDTINARGTRACVKEIN